MDNIQEKSKKRLENLLPQLDTRRMDIVAAFAEGMVISMQCRKDEKKQKEVV